MEFNIITRLSIVLLVAVVISACNTSLNTNEKPFPYNWEYYKKSGKWYAQADIDSLNKLLNSDIKCKCYMSPISSNTPPQGEYATVSALAAAYLVAIELDDNSFMGLYYCPKTKEEVFQDKERFLEHKRLYK